MLKALLMASVIIGAFLFQPPANAQESGSNPCPLGGTLFEDKCLTPAPLGESWQSFRSGVSYGFSDDRLESMQLAIDAYVSYENSRETSGGWSQSVTVSEVIPYNAIRINVVEHKYCKVGQPDQYYCPINYNNVFISGFSQLLVTAPKCAPDGHPQFNLGPISISGTDNYCYYMAATPENDNECPPGTIGGCDEPPEEPECSIGGNGMEVCPADPNEKCSSYQHEGKTFYDCPSNCGFIQDQFFCTTEPDSDGEIPDMSKCFKVATGWACPPDSPTPDDNIDNPEKTLPDMTKGDFKETNKGVETRLDATNLLLGDIAGTGEATNQGIADLNAKALAANGILSQIRQNTGATAGNTADIKDALTGDGMDLDDNHRGLIGGALGITGDESIDDLTKEEITLDSFRSDFQWSGGGGSCPAPRQINILGASFHMDWHPYCEAFAVASHFILAAAYFFAAFIAFGGRK
ncbi:MAG: virulence factor TspB C-terminal domain-related protein [Alishewanella agri]|nr:virulence factor TspB C-terminal domain-related protein [Alishewanella agri]